MKFKKILVLLSFFLLSSDSYAKGQPFLKVLLLNEFSVLLSQDVLNKKNIAKLAQFLEKKGGELYSGQKQVDVPFYFGVIQFEKKGPKFLWCYKDLDIHHGVFIMLNEYLEVIYHTKALGTFKGLELKDLFDVGKNVLMLTHAAGGTGVRFEYTDLITFEQGLVELKASFLRSDKNYNLFHFTFGTDTNSEEYEALGPIEVKTDFVLRKDPSGKNELCLVLIVCDASNRSILPSKIVKEIDELLEKKFSLKNPKTTFERALTIKTLHPLVVQETNASIPVELFFDKTAQTGVMPYLLKN